MSGWLACTLAAVALGAALLRQRAALRDLRRRARKATSDLEQLQGAFERFTPAHLVDRIANEGLQERAEKREVAVLFADIQGFTELSDAMDPVELVALLNGYFAAMSTAIAAHHGFVSKFIGDGLLALFGAVSHNPWLCGDAVDAALAMRAALAEYNRTLASRGVPPLRIGIGVHHGPVVAGVMGSDRLLEFTVIGDVVNVASRVEGLTRTHAVDVLITGEVRSALGPGFKVRELPALPVKGKPRPIVTWAVEGRASPGEGDGEPAQR